MRMKIPGSTSDGVRLENILFATDFSAASLQAMPYATAIARQFNSKLFLAHVVPPEDYPSGFKSFDEAAQRACRDAKAKIDSLLLSASCRDIVCETEVGSGDIWLGLNEFLRRHAIDLLVMGTVGRRGAKKVLLGSVAEEAMRESRCPALTVGPHVRVPRTDFQKILYATDFSGDSLAGVPYALGFAEKYASHLVLVHALEGLPESPYLDGRMATVHLRELVPPGLHLADVPEAIVEMGSPADVIIEAAEKVAADLIVIGARGAGSLARLASHFGSVAHKIVCRAPCPVLTVRRLVENGAKGIPAPPTGPRHK